MIVKDQLLSISKASDISTKLVQFILEETKNFHPDDDPAEQIYLACHILGSLTAKIVFALDGYGKIYNIEDLTIDTLLSWIQSILKEYLDAYTKEEHI